MKSEATVPEISSRASAPLWASAIATLLGIGRLRPGPGTWASAAAALIWWAIARRVGTGLQTPVLAGLIALVIVIGIPAATLAARAAGQEDPGFVVIDEVAGQWIALLFVPLSWKTLLVGFILFRSFDIVKPPPARQLERLPEGMGIVMDDVAAGAYALLVMQLVLHFRLLSP
jgi:phosphatidylglycerophosphatase A